MEDSLPRGALPGKALVPSVILGLVVFVATLGGPFAVLVAAALVWLWRGRPIWLAAVLALALGLASWAMSRGDRTVPRELATGARAPAVVARADARTSDAPNPRGEWKYGVVPADTTPAPVAGSGLSSAAPAPAPASVPTPAAAPASPPKSAPAPAPAPSTRVVAGPPTAPARRGAYRVVAVEGGGTIKGFVRLEQAASLPPVQVTKDHDRGCGAKEQPSERLVADPATLGVANVLVSIPAIAEGVDWPEASRAEDRSLVIDQKGCRYVPHVVWARPGTQLVVLNSDRADHNIHGYRSSMKDTAFNFSSEPGTRKDDVEQAFLEAEAPYILKCDIHPWMSGYVHVVGNPYADVTDATGAFELTGVPPGEHVLHWWKEGTVETPSIADGKISAYTYSPDYGASVKVTVRAGETATVEIPIGVK